MHASSCPLPPPPFTQACFWLWPGSCRGTTCQRPAPTSAPHTPPPSPYPLRVGVLLALAGILQRHDLEAPPGKGKARSGKGGGDALSAAIIGLSHLSDGDGPTQALLMQV